MDLFLTLYIMTCCSVELAWNDVDRLGCYKDTNRKKSVTVRVTWQPKHRNESLANPKDFNLKLFFLEEL
jgi:hypothetical protein